MFDSVTLWTAAHQAFLPFTISQSLLKLMSIESMMPSNHLILCCPLLFPLSIFPSIRVFSNELAVCIKVATVLELQIQHHSFQWIFKIDFLKDWLVWSPYCSRDSQESSLQHHNLKTSVLQGSALCMDQLSHPYMTTGKTIALTDGPLSAKWYLYFLICCLGLPLLFFQGASIF